MVTFLCPPTLKSRGLPMYWSPPTFIITFILIGWSNPYIQNRSSAPNDNVFIELFILEII